MSTHTVCGLLTVFDFSALLSILLRNLFLSSSSIKLITSSTNLPWFPHSRHTGRTHLPQSSRTRQLPKPSNSRKRPVSRQVPLTNYDLSSSNPFIEFTPITLTHYPSIPTLQCKSGNTNTLNLPEELRQIVANQTTFTALSKEGGRVYTWGDGRYPNCLGREISDEWLVSEFKSKFHFLRTRVLQLSNLEPSKYPKYRGRSSRASWRRD